MGPRMPGSPGGRSMCATRTLLFGDRRLALQRLVPVTTLARQVYRRRRLRHHDRGEQLRLEALEVARPLLVVVHADGQADRAVVVLREVREAAAGVDHVAV